MKFTAPKENIGGNQEEEKKAGKYSQLVLFFFFWHPTLVWIPPTEGGSDC